MTKKLLVLTLKSWLPLAAVIVTLCGMVYAVAQQTYRQTANDPQIQIVGDLVDAISLGTPPDSIIPPTGGTEISKTLAPWVMIYNDSGKLLGSSAVLNGKTPSFPQGVMDNVRKTGKNEAITWQPEKGIRMAAFVGRYNGQVSGFVVAGRSLREVENRISQLCVLVTAGMLFSLLLSFLIISLFKKMSLEQESSSIVEVVEEKIIV